MDTKQTEASRYYAATFPEKLYVHGSNVSTNEDPDETAGFIALLQGPEQIAFMKELARRWNKFPVLEQSLMDIREMAQKRKSCIRMPQGTMLDNYCTQILKT